MAEGPQVWLRARWLERQLAGKTPLAVEGYLEELKPSAQQLAQLRIERAFARGKNLFLEFDGGLFLHNHLRMQGRWRVIKLEEPIPDRAWLGFRLGDRRVINLEGEVLQLMGREGVRALVASLGPDVMQEPFPRNELLVSIARARGSIASALIDQHVLSGVGNIARCEALFRAGVDPAAPCKLLPSPKLEALVDSIYSITRDCMAHAGRWNPQVYERSGQKCMRCDGEVTILRVESSHRRIYGCARCQQTVTKDLYTNT